jgi:hypothetical protein
MMRGAIFSGGSGLDAFRFGGKFGAGVTAGKNSILVKHIQRDGFDADSFILI